MPLKRAVLVQGCFVLEIKRLTEITVLLVDKWTSSYEEQSGSKCCQEMRWWREKYWGLQELPCLLNKLSMMFAHKRLCCFRIHLSLPCLNQYICFKETTYMFNIYAENSFWNCFGKQHTGTASQYKQFLSKQSMTTVTGCF